MNTYYKPELLYMDGTFEAGKGLLVDDRGCIAGVVSDDAAGGLGGFDLEAQRIDLPRKALLPAFANAHSHAFQRLIRGKAESRSVSGNDFWSWRGTMYRAAAQLTPEDLYDVARMAFLEMLLAGTATVGEFHYLHTDAAARAYDDPNLLSRQMIAAARSVGIRIVLLRSAYLRSGYEVPPDPGQLRFFEPASAFLQNMQTLVADYADQSAQVRFGVAPHSIRAVALADLAAIAEYAASAHLPLHMHVAEQPAENAACLREHGCTPVRLLARHHLLSERFVAVHAIHTQPEELALLADQGALLCSCPTTERNLGDGILAADLALAAGVRIALGSDSQAQIDPLEDARELDYHLRLRDKQRAILDRDQPIAEQLFTCATRNGAAALDVPSGSFKPGLFADAFTVDLDEVSIAGHSPSDLLPLLVFGLNRSAVRDVLVNGRLVVQDGKHALQSEIVARYRQLHARVWHPHAAPVAAR